MGLVDILTLFLKQVAAAPHGHTLNNIGTMHPYNEALHQGLVHYGRREVFLTQKGIRRIGAHNYRAYDPTTWTDAARVDYYTQGMCHVFAIAAHKLTNFPIWVMFDPDPNRTTCAGEYDVVHVFVSPDKSGSLDIRGWKDHDLDLMQPVTRDCGGYVQPLTLSELMHHVGPNKSLIEFDDYDITMAQTIVCQWLRERKVTPI